MKFNSGAVILSTLFLLTLTKAQTQMQLQCYVCENCPEINVDTPKLDCNEDYFNTGGTTMSSVMTTTPSDPTMTTPEVTTTTEAETTTTTTPTTTSTTTAETTTMEPSTTIVEEDTTTETSTETPKTSPPTPPTPATVGPAITPPNVGTAAVIDLVSLVNRTEGSLNRTDAGYKVESADVATGTTETTTVASPKEYTNSTQFRVRQQRAITNTDVTYHCFTIKKKVNNTMITDRGCSRVTTEQAVCEQLQEMNNHTISKCTPCSLSKCNGSSMLSVSMATILIACIAALMRQ